VPGSRRSQRQRAVSELRAQGRYGPELREVLPGFLALGAALFAPALLLAWFYRTFGVVGLLLGVVALAAAGAAGWQVVRRRDGQCTPAALARLDDHGLVLAAERMLRRDGWHVTNLSEHGSPRLYAPDRRARRRVPPGGGGRG